jgi:hypothetical protein
MPGDRPERPDRLRDGLGTVGHVAAGVLAFIALIVLSTRLRLVAMLLIIVPIGVVILLVTSALWGGLLAVVGRVLGLPIGPNEGLPAAEGAGQVMVLLLAFGPPLVVTAIVALWVLRRLSLFLDRVTSYLGG